MPTSKRRFGSTSAVVVVLALAAGCAFVATNSPKIVTGVRRGCSGND